MLLLPFWAKRASIQPPISPPRCACCRCSLCPAREEERRRPYSRRSWWRVQISTVDGTLPDAELIAAQQSSDDAQACQVCVRGLKFGEYVVHKVPFTRRHTENMFA